MTKDEKRFIRREIISFVLRTSDKGRALSSIKKAVHLYEQKAYGFSMAIYHKKG